MRFEVDPGPLKIAPPFVAEFPESKQLVRAKVLVGLLEIAPPVELAEFPERVQLVRVRLPSLRIAPPSLAFPFARVSPVSWTWAVEEVIT